MTVRLPVVEARQRELETCGYCPKLCRAACPVSTVTHSETLTPWGKMTSVWQAGLGHTSLDAEHAALAWACSDCKKNLTLCDHKNPMADTLLDARADYFAQGLAPRSVVDDPAKQARRAARRKSAAERLAALAGPTTTAAATLLIGCGYLTRLPEVAEDIVRVAAQFVGPVRISQECCGAPAFYAGDRAAQYLSGARLARDSAGTQLVVADPGCARVLTQPYTLLLTLVERALGNVVEVRRHALGLDAASAVRWHDPCQLGRGLGQFAAPRAILKRLLGQPAQEFTESAEHANCSGGGGSLPRFDADIAGKIAARRVAEHQGDGGGTIVTGCASSLRQFGAQGVDAIDLFTLVRRGWVT